jgi:hypothetical protein
MTPRGLAPAPKFADMEEDVAQAAGARLGGQRMEGHRRPVRPRLHGMVARGQWSALPRATKARGTSWV